MKYSSAREERIAHADRDNSELLRQFKHGNALMAIMAGKQCDSAKVSSEAEDVSVTRRTFISNPWAIYFGFGPYWPHPPFD